jgi:hypothetical protein
MELLGDVGHVKSRFSPFGDCVSAIVLLVDEAHVDACLVHLEIVLILTQDRCTVCTERTIRLRNCFGRTRWNS